MKRLNLPLSERRGLAERLATAFVGDPATVNSDGDPSGGDNLR